MPKILAITGCSGRKSGGAFTRLISLNKNEINKLYPDGVRYLTRSNLNLDGDIRTGDLKDIEYLNKTLKDVDTLVHIAGIHYSKNIIDACVLNKVRRVILVHTTGIYSKYKKAGEEYRKIDEYVISKCKENGIIYTILRPTMIYGNIYDNNVIKFIKMLDKLPIMPVVNNANYELQPVYYGDLANAYYDVLINEKVTTNKEYNLSGKEPILLKEMFNEIGRNLNKNIKYLSVPFTIAYFGAWFIYIITFTKIDYREKVQRLCEPRVYSHIDATSDFGYNPIDFKDGVKEEVKQYLNTK